jgi:NADPH:quinone reductase-like Zn-dependent oxidoreductase
MGDSGGRPGCDRDFMWAVSQRALGGPEALEIVEVPRPSPGPGEALIRVHAASVNAADWKHRSGLLRRFGDPPFRAPLSGVKTRAA